MDKSESSNGIESALTGTVMDMSDMVCWRGCDEMSAAMGQEWAAEEDACMSGERIYELGD